MRISVACVTADLQQYYTELDLAVGATIYEALLATGWLDDAKFADFATWCVQNRTNEPNHKAWRVGIFSQKKRLDTPLAEGDRVEIYRPLNIEPMAKRKALSKKSRSECS